MPFNRVLIANRGEVAVRVIRGLHELGIEAVAVYSQADEGALHTRLADRAVCIGPAPPGESYLKIPSLIAAVLMSDAGARSSTSSRTRGLMSITSYTPCRPR